MHNNNHNNSDNVYDDVHDDDVDDDEHVNVALMIGSSGSSSWLQVGSANHVFLLQIPGIMKSMTHLFAQISSLESKNPCCWCFLRQKTFPPRKNWAKPLGLVAGNRFSGFQMSSTTRPTRLTSSCWSLKMGRISVMWIFVVIQYLRLSANKNIIIPNVLHLNSFSFVVYAAVVVYIWSCWCYIVFDSWKLFFYFFQGAGLTAIADARVRRVTWKLNP